MTELVEKKAPERKSAPSLAVKPASDELHDAYRRLSAAQAATPFPSLKERRENLKKLLAALDEHRIDLITAVNADFGNRPRQETELAELFVVEREARHAIRLLRRWMAPRSQSTALHWFPGKSYLLPEPLGVAAIISPWNYPIQLTFAPLIAALAAGNRVLIKPSEHTPQTSMMIARIVAQCYSSDTVTVVQGDADVAEAVCALPLDHLFFTGSTAVGKKVALAAAANLTPMTLELGGKSPAIVDHSANVKMAAARIAQGKLLNSGQTCVAPDYALVHKTHIKAFTDAYRNAARSMYGAVPGSDAAAILGDQRAARLKRMREEARLLGGEVISLFDDSDAIHALIINPPMKCKLMQEEIFGPLLPVIGFGDIDDAITIVRRYPNPLALYWFGSDKQKQERVLTSCRAGGVTINGTIWHMAQDNLPFGGTGQSGVGAYHGRAGFDRFSNLKPIFVERCLSGSMLFRPPYGGVFDFLLRALRQLP